MLGPLQGLSVLDLFAGTGALGIEALSRGAERAVFVDCERRALSFLARNIDALRLPEGEAEVRCEDALLAVRRAVRRGETFDLIFVDPPYALAQRLAPSLAQCLPLLLRQGGRVVLQSDAREGLQLPLAPFVQRRYRDTSITICTADERAGTKDQS